MFIITLTHRQSKSILSVPKYFQLLEAASEGETGEERSMQSGAVRCRWFLSTVTGKEYRGGGILRPIFVFRLSLTNDKVFHGNLRGEEFVCGLHYPEIRYQQKVKWESAWKDKLRRDYTYTDSREVTKIKSSKISGKIPLILVNSVIYCRSTTA